MFAFIDESCFLEPQTENSKANGDISPFATLVAACIHERYIGELDRSFFRIKRDIFGEGKKVEIKAENFIHSKIFISEKNKECIEKVFDVIAGIKMHFLGIICERPTHRLRKDRNSLLPYHYTQLMNKIDSYAIQQQQDIFVVFDNQSHGKDAELSFRYGNLVHKARHIERLQASPFFVSSAIVPGIQIADIVAGLLRHYYCMRESLCQSTYSEEFKIWLQEKYEFIRPMFPSVDKSSGIYYISRKTLEEVLGYEN